MSPEHWKRLTRQNNYQYYFSNLRLLPENEAHAATFVGAYSGEFSSRSSLRLDQPEAVSLQALRA